jgi:AbrB family looped-hinge helix DNA binding protein
MLTSVRVQEKGQVTIPNDIRKKLNLKKGDLVTFLVTESGVEIKPLQQAADKLLKALQKRLQRRNIYLDKLMERAMISGGDDAAREFGLAAEEKASLYQILQLRAQAALETIRASTEQKGLNRLSLDEINAEIQAARQS